VHELSYPKQTEGDCTKPKGFGQRKIKQLLLLLLLKLRLRLSLSQNLGQARKQRLSSEHQVVMDIERQAQSLIGAMPRAGF